MIHSLTGELRQKRGRFVVIGVAGISFKITVPVSLEARLPEVGEDITLYTYLHVREGGMDLYGFLTEEEHSLFELLVSVSGIGPKSAMSILSVAPTSQLTTAISSGEAELLQKSSGIGRKTAERIVLELKDKVFSAGDEGRTASVMQSDSDVYEALVNLGYSRKQAKEALGEIDSSLTSTSDRLRDALKKVRQ